VILRIDRNVSGGVDAPPSRCLEVLADVETWPDWSRLIAAVEVLERGGDGRPSAARLRADVLGLKVIMDCVLEFGPDRALLRRVPYGPGDDERYEATFTVGDGTVDLQVTAAIDAPGPAGVLRGRVSKRLADDLLADFVAAVER
jgi:Polyketide cyclase / dehydrase and lipid transport